MITLTREEAQQVLAALEDIADGAEESHKTKEAIETLRARLSAPEPDIVQDAIVYGTGMTMNGNRIDPDSIYKEPDPEPVAWLVRDYVDGLSYPCAFKDPAGSIKGESVPLYLHPPQREWQGLTDEEMFDCLAQTDGEAKRLPLGFKWFAEAIEAKLKEKNT